MAKAAAGARGRAHLTIAGGVMFPGTSRRLSGELAPRPGMSISRRIATLFRVKADKALDRAEDPREVLDYSYEQQLEMVQVDGELARMKGQLPASAAPPALEGPGTASAGPPASPPEH